MEAYEGVVILATNLRENMDEAFTRRIRFIVDFPFPDAASRKLIWQTHFPREAPVSADLDYDWLAQQLQITGGNIKNIVLNAAFFAAADGGVIGMDACAARRPARVREDRQTVERQALRPATQRRMLYGCDTSRHNTRPTKEPRLHRRATDAPGSDAGPETA